MSKSIRNALAAGMAVSSLVLVSQVSADTVSNNATATVIDPIAVTAGADLDFGSFVAGAGNVVMSSAGDRSSTGPVLVAAEAGAAAVFTVAGEPDMAYSITLPSTAELSDDTPITPNTMTASNFTASEATDGTAVLDPNGAASFNVGATLAVSSDQVSGTYTGTFDVTVDYN